MKKSAAIVGFAVVLIFIGLLSYRWISSSVASTVKMETAKMVDRENSNLPKLVGDHVTMEFIEHDVESQRLTFKYRVDTVIPPEQFTDLRETTNQRILADRNVTRAMNHGVEVFHRFRGPNGETILEFETKK